MRLKRGRGGRMGGSFMVRRQTCATSMPAAALPFARRIAPWPPNCRPMAAGRAKPGLGIKGIERQANLGGFLRRFLSQSLCRFGGDISARFAGSRSPCANAILFADEFLHGRHAILDS